MKKIYICKVNFIVEGDIEDLDKQNKMDKILDSFTAEMSDSGIEHVSTQFSDVSENSNLGKCKNCGAWASDYRYEGFIQEVSNGAVLNNCWYCDLCLPIKHENHF